MKQIILIPCVKQKINKPALARDLYTSKFFRLCYQYAQHIKPDAMYILSAKYGLVEPDQIIEPYDITLNSMSEEEMRKWSSRVIESLRQKVDLQNDHFIFLVGNRYRKYLIPMMKYFDIPMQGLRIGEQMHYLKSRIR